MEKSNLIFYTLIFFVAVVSLKMYYESDAFNLKCIVSTVDGDKYCVRERNKIQLVADLLAKTTVNMKKLVAHLSKKYPTRENVKRLVKNFNPKKVMETLPTSKFTAYSENKGEKIAFCTTTQKGGNELIDENTLMFVALHELSHVMTVSIGHKKEFWDNFKFLIGEANEIKIYKPIDYKKNPQTYCGMNIRDSPYFDL